MGERLLASIIISSYNYGRFLGQAIDSALNQSYSHTEVIVVDDGSSDHSREVIAGYGTRIHPLLKENGGQASAFNAGFRVSRGNVVLFLDSDDLLLPGAVERALDRFASGATAKVHWPLWEIDAAGHRTGKISPEPPLPEGDLREVVAQRGPLGYDWPATSGNAWSRRFLSQIVPIPEWAYRTCPDLYLAALVPLFGLIRSIPEPQGCWRKHGKNNTWGDPIHERAEVEIRRLECSFDVLYSHCQQRGLRPHPDIWRRESWWHRLEQATREITALIPSEAQFILVDENQWQAGEVIALRRPLPFLERDGIYWGLPPDDETGIRELERLRAAGAQFIIFAWPAFWWLDYYAGLRRHLEANFPCLLENERLVVFGLRAAGTSALSRSSAGGQGEGVT